MSRSRLGVSLLSKRRSPVDVKVSATVASLLALFLAPAAAQTIPGTTAADTLGDQAYQSYQGGNIDSINLSTGDLTINHPFLSYPQRGSLHLSFNLIYNNKHQHQAQWCDSEQPPSCVFVWNYFPYSDPLGDGGGSVGVTWAQNVAVLQQIVPVTTGTGQTLKTTYYGNYFVQTVDGSMHVLGNQGSSSLTLCCGNLWHQTSTGPFESLDATGWRVNGPLSTTGALNTSVISQPLYVPAVDQQGIQYTASVVGGHQATTIMDPNGNTITPSSTGLTDTLGRLIPWSGSSTNTTGCTGPLPTTSATAWSVPGYNGSTQTYKFCSAQVTTNMNPAQYYSPLGGFMLQCIVLPNGQTWEFEYNDPDSTLTYNGQPVTYGTLTKVTLPTGGTVSYTYTTSAGVGGHLGRIVSTRTVTDDSGAHTWTYTYNGGTTVTDPLGNDVVHTFATAFGSRQYEIQTAYWQGSSLSGGGGTLLKTVTTNYSYSSSFNTTRGTATNVVPISVTTVWANGQTTSLTKSYDPSWNYVDYYGHSLNPNQQQNIGIYGKETSRSEYDYPSGTSLLRTTNTSYAWQSPNPNYSSYLSNNLLDLDYSVQVKDGGGTQRAYTFYGHDESGLQSSGVTEQHVAGESHPGNQTSVHRWLNGSTTATTNCNVSVSNGYLVSNKVFYDTGEVQKTTDPCAYSTTYQYAATPYYGAFLTTATNFLNQSTNYAYDFNTGALTSVTDPNSQVTTKVYDIMNRPTQISYPDGGSTTACYTDMGGATCTQSSAPPYEAVLTKAITSTLNETSTLVFDNLGRLSQTQLNSDSPSTTYTLTTYDALGRKSQVYNPTRCSPITTNCGETTWGYTTYNYDPLGRVTSVVEQDTSSVSSSYAAFPCTTVTDEAGKARKSCVDGLGRMTGVWEDPSVLDYETDYQYDALGNLTYVNQKGSNVANARNRTFQYDSLSELTSAATPESGTILYAYDADGNVVTKTAPLPNQTGTSTVTTTNTYDKLNRLTGKGYNDGTTPQVQFGYDAIALTGCTTAPSGDTDSYPIGRRTSMCDGSGATALTHDQMGRILQERRTIGTAVGKYETDGYNLAGLPGTITTLNYGVGYTYNRAGRPITATNYSGTTTNFVSGATYAPPGGLASITMGSATGFNGIVTTNAFNDRLQPILLSAASPSGTVFSLCFDFHLGVAVNTAPCSFSASTAGDNGNINQIVNNRDNSRTENYTYDSLNRIASGQSSGTQWGETFTIDSWGNLTNEAAIAGKTSHEGLNTSAGTNNRLAGFGYDAAGNMTSNGSTSYVYDAENRLVWTSGYRYLYDGDGQRVEKCVAATSTTACPTSGTNGTLYWRGTGSDTLAESDLSGNALEDYVFFNGQRVARRDVSTNNVHYYFSDHLGSHGVVENATGTTCEQDIDYYPYGGVEHDYCPSVAQNYKFTGKERDGESGLDHFGARHHASALGRFMSADPKLMTARHLGFPQKWNKYAYVQNNPLARFDPDGQDDWVVFRTALDPKTNKEVLAGTHTKEWSAAEKAIKSQKDSKGGSNTFKMWEGKDATVERMRTAQNTPDTHVVFVGHSQDSASGRANAIVLSDGISSGKDGSQINLQPGPNADAAPQVLTPTYGLGDPISASSVALFGCNTYDLASEYPGADFTGVQSNPVTTIEALDLAAVGHVTAGGGQAGDNAGNAAIENSGDKRDTGSNVVTDDASQ